MPARIALNGRFSGTAQPTGTQTAAYGLFDGIVRRNREFELIVFADPRFRGIAAWGGLPGVALVETPFLDWSRNRCQLWEQFVLPGLCRRMECAAVHHPITTSPCRKRGVPTVVTLHDLNFYLHPEWYGLPFRLAFSAFAIPGVKKAERVVVISDYVRRQAIEALGLPEERVTRIYNGVTPIPWSEPEPGRPRYVLCVGSLPPHKNLLGILRAFRRVRSDFPGLELHVVGRPHPKMGREDPALPGLLAADGVRILGYLGDGELARAYCGAAAFCYPSFEEGFGLPVLEAMSAGVPVVTSDRSCLPEIAGAAAILVDPASDEAIAGGLRRALLLAPDERAAMAATGRNRAAAFTWEAAADRYLDVYRELAP